MLLDILLGVPLIMFFLLGLRDGIVRKIVASIVFVAALFIGQMYMREVGNFLYQNDWVSQENSAMYGFLLIFILIAIAQGILYKVITGSYKIGGIADRIGGMIFGFVEGVIFLSALLFILALAGIPSRETARYSKFYKPIVNIAPQILDVASTTGTETFDKIKKYGSPDDAKKDTSSKIDEKTKRK